MQNMEKTHIIFYKFTCKKQLCSGRWMHEMLEAGQNEKENEHRRLKMSAGMLILTTTAVLVFFGIAQRVLDRMRLTDRQALLLVSLMFVGTLLPNITLGMVSLSLGGALIPLGVCIYLLVSAGTKKEVLRSLIGAVLTGAAVYVLSVFLPDEPEQMWIEPNILYGLSGGVIAYLLGRSRRAAFICGVLGVMLADIANAFVVWIRGTQQQLVLGGAGLADSVVISGILAVLLAELVGEIMERIQRGKTAQESPAPERRRVR